MATATLVNYEIKEGKRLLDALNEAGLAIDSALWIYDPERELWQLTIALPLYDTHGMLKSYEEILTVFHQVEPELNIDWTALVAVSPQDKLIDGLRQFKHQFDLDLSEKRIANNAIDTILVEDAYIYQIKS